MAMRDQRNRPSGVLHRLCLVAAMSLVLASCAGPAAWRHSGLNYPASISWNDTRWCVPFRLKLALWKISRRYGPVTVHSTHRWPFENRRKGGKKRSYHLTCRAVDFSVRGDPSGVMGYLRASPLIGGHSRYPRGFYHIDTGPKRSW